MILAAGYFAAAFAAMAACQRKKCPRIMTFRELYEDNDVSLEALINGQPSAD